MTALDLAHAENPWRDRRNAVRRRSLLSAKLVYGREGMTLDCTIRDISRTGAQVKVAGAAPLPGVLHLVELNKGVAYEAQVVWREFPRFGLKYLKAHDLAHDSAPERKVLRQVWQEHLAR